MYQALPTTEPLSQGDLIDDCPLYAYIPSGPDVDLNAAPRRWRARVVVMTQSCDLAQGKTSRVVVATVHEAARLVSEGTLKAAVIRDQVRRGLYFGWYFLPASAGPVGVPESLINLRELYTVSLLVLNRLIADGKRVCRVVTPYREHLAQHFAVTYMRIGLPAPYETEP